MLISLLLVLREGLEATLIVGIVFSFLRKSGQLSQARYAWAGCLAAVALSGLLAFGINAIGTRLEGTAEQLFEGATMLFAVAMLTWMIFWMRRQARNIKGELEGKLALALRGGHTLALFGVTFFALFREGVETALLLGAASFQADGSATLVGALLGLAAATVLGYLVYAAAVRLNLRLFFNITSLLLLVFAAGLVTRSVHEFQEAGFLPLIIEPIWDLNPFVAGESLLGQILGTLAGYTPAPSLLETIGYVGYWAAVLLGIRVSGAIPVRSSRPS